MKTANTAVLAGLLAISMVVSHPLFASCPKSPVEYEFKVSDIVFTGAMESKTVAPEKYNRKHLYRFDGKKDVRALQLRFTVERTWKGNLSTLDFEEMYLYVVDPEQDSSAGYDFKKGERYVVFARYHELEPEKDGEETETNLWTDLCYDNIDLGNVEDEAALISKLGRLSCEEDPDCEYVEGDSNSEPETRFKSPTSPKSKGDGVNLFAPAPDFADIKVIEPEKN